MAFVGTLTCRPAIHWLRIFSATILLVAVAFLFVGSAQGGPASEYQVKAAFLFNFAKFVSWPPHAFPDANTPFVIGVLGRDPFGSHLDDTVRGERINNRQLVVRRYHSAAEINNCHVLFISRSESDRLDQIVAALKNRTLLIVTDADGGKGGVIIRFVTEGNRIRFKIDAEAAKSANLTISSKLLRLG
jgi:hypothetical protein